MTVTTSMKIVDTIKTTIAQMVANNGYQVRPTAIYANPVLLDLIDQEMKTDYNVVLNTTQISGGLYGEESFDASRRPASDSRLELALYGHAGHRAPLCFRPTS